MSPNSRLPDVPSVLPRWYLSLIRPGVAPATIPQAILVIASCDTLAASAPFSSRSRGSAARPSPVASPRSCTASGFTPAGAETQGPIPAARCAPPRGQTNNSVRGVGCPLSLRSVPEFLPGRAPWPGSLLLAHVPTLLWRRCPGAAQLPPALAASCTLECGLWLTTAAALSIAPIRSSFPPSFPQQQQLLPPPPPPPLPPSRK